MRKGGDAYLEDGFVTTHDAVLDFECRVYDRRGRLGLAVLDPSMHR